MYHVEVYTSRYVPAEAEITIVVAMDSVAAGVELQGRLIGPRTLYAETIEVAYPLRPLPSQPDSLRARVVIPEANPWTPQAPFLYEGVVEFWRGSEILERSRVLHGIRQITINRHGLHLNGARLSLLGLTLRNAGETGEKELRKMHDKGCNLLVMPAAAEGIDVWTQADRYGFFVVAQIDPEDEAFLWCAEPLAGRTSTLGWLLPQSLIENRQRWHGAMSILHGPGRRSFVGIKVEELPLPVLPGHVSFLACDEALVPQLADVALPLIVQTRREQHRATSLEGIDPRRIWGYLHHDLAG